MCGLLPPSTGPRHDYTSLAVAHGALYGWSREPTGITNLVYFDQKKKSILSRALSYHCELYLINTAIIIENAEGLRPVLPGGLSGRLYCEKDVQRDERLLVGSRLSPQSGSRVGERGADNFVD